jgi:hypothetical protein
MLCHIYAIHTHFGFNGEKIWYSIFFFFFHYQLNLVLYINDDRISYYATDINDG